MSENESYLPDDQTVGSENGDVNHPRATTEKRCGPTETEKSSSKKVKGSDTKSSDLLYSINQTPALYMSIILGLQHMLTSIGASIVVPALLSNALCGACPCDDKASVQGELLNTLFFVSGLVTILQSTLGTRLPIIQGGTVAFLLPTFAIINLDKFQCRSTGDAVGNATITLADGDDEWKIRMREIQGAIIAASLFQVFLGAFGLVGIIARYIGPLVIAPTIALIGLSLFGVSANFSDGNWYVALMTIAFILLFSQYLRNVSIPCFCCQPGQKGCSKKTNYPFFKLYPIILAILLSWFVCWILTLTDAFPDDPSHFAYAARTDIRTKLLHDAKWFRFPYPFQWGRPTFSTAPIFGMLSGVLAGMIESIGDYYACARASGAPPPPIHAINRGVFIEGIGCVLSGMWGSGNGTTSHSENIAVISITKVGSRRVVQWAGLSMIIIGMIGKFGAFLVNIPDPVVGGVFLVLFGMIAAVGISNLQYVDMNSSRNLCIFGFSLMFGLALPEWLSRPENQGVISTGNDVVDQIFTVLLNTNMFVGGAVAFILDNTVPGTEKERGLLAWRTREQTEDPGMSYSCYEFPVGMAAMRRARWTRFIPICPTFRGLGSCGRIGPNKNDESDKCTRL